jgi:hypothetical protein
VAAAVFPVLDYDRQLHERYAPPALLGPRALWKDVSQAINKKAYALSLHAFEKNRDYPEQWARRYAGDPARQLDGIHALDLDDGQHVVVVPPTFSRG